MHDTALQAHAIGNRTSLLGDAMPHPQWIAAAMQRLQAEWPEADARRLHDIADELFADPRSGLLDPLDAVEGWLHLLSGHG
jgi:hypothetical protein